jgi:HSP20 family molecular chaperone IbpA
MTQAKTKVNVNVASGKESSAPTPENSYSPFVDIYEAEDSTVMLVAEMPGTTQDKLDVRVDKGVLTIEGPAEVQAFGGDYSPTYVDFEGGRYFRAFALSDEVDREKIEASLDNGLLTIRLPRAKSARTKKISIT